MENEMLGSDPAFEGGAEPLAQGKVVSREKPENVPEQRAALVEQWCKEVQQDIEFFRPAFKRMRDNQDFVRGKQWPAGAEGPDGYPNYVANVTMRAIKHATDRMYARDPTFTTRRKEKLLSTVWDGSMQTAIQAMQTFAAPAQQQPGMPPAPVDPAAQQQAMAIIQDFTLYQQETQRLDKLAKTLQLVFEHQLAEQIPPFKASMRRLINTSQISMVGYLKLGYQRAMEPRPDVAQGIADATDRLAKIERRAADLADEQYLPEDAEAEALRLTVQQLQAEPMVLIREGLTFDFPSPTAVIPSRECKWLNSFLGAPYVTQEHLLTPERVQEIYGVDVRSSFRAYRRDKGSSEPQSFVLAENVMTGERGDKGSDFCRVWEIWCKNDGLVFTICEGWPDFLREPEAPEIKLERFYPFFPLMMNDLPHDEEIFPVSDVELLRDPQMEINRARQGLREHRQANRPKIMTAAGALSEVDREKLQSHPANAVIELQSLQPGQDVKALLQAFSGAPIDPAMYDTAPSFQDILRTTGTQEADIGGTSGATATEAAIAANSRRTGTTSEVDALDDFLSEVARNAGQVLFREMDAETVTRIVGPGAMWPEQDDMQIAEEVLLDVRAGSTGKPNKAEELANAREIVPILLQVPGIDPLWLAREMVRRLDDKVDLTEAIVAGLPSIASLNQQTQVTGAPPDKDPNAQGAEGANKAPRDATPSGNPGARPPETASMDPMAAGTQGAPPMQGNRLAN